MFNSFKLYNKTSRIQLKNNNKLIITHHNYSRTAICNNCKKQTLTDD